MQRADLTVHFFQFAGNAMTQGRCGRASQLARHTSSPAAPAHQELGPVGCEDPGRTRGRRGKGRVSERSRRGRGTQDPAMQRTQCSGPMEPDVRCGVPLTAIPLHGSAGHGARGLRAQTGAGRGVVSAGLRCAVQHLQDPTQERAWHSTHWDSTHTHGARGSAGAQGRAGGQSHLGVCCAVGWRWGRGRLVQQDVQQQWAASASGALKSSQGHVSLQGSFSSDLNIRRKACPAPLPPLSPCP